MGSRNSPRHPRWRLLLWMLVASVVQAWLPTAPSCHTRSRTRKTSFPTTTLTESDTATTATTMRRRLRSISLRRRSTSTCRWSSSSPTTESSEGRDVYLVSWEECLVDTVPWRTATALQVCAEVWPDLQVLLEDDNDLGWLYNKVRDLHHVLTLNPDYSPVVEYAVLVRMLLEEQELDRGQSNGSRGKYGSKYHPSAGDAFTEAPPQPRRQRPLTVGEIAANWQESLCEAVLIRYYREEKQNPLDMLQEAIDQLELASPVEIPDSLWIAPRDLEVLREQSRSVIVVAPHDTDVRMVQETLQTVHPTLCSSLAKALAVENGVAVLCQSKTLVREVLESLPPASSLFVLDASWPLLQASIPLFGDCVPRQANTANRCSISDRFLQLALWRSRHPNDQAAATMNAWTSCLDPQHKWPAALVRASSSSVTRR